MAFAIRQLGKRKELIAFIQAQKEMGPDGKVAADQTQIDAAKALAISEINALDPKVTGAHVMIEGHAHENGRKVDFQVLPHNIL